MIEKKINKVLDTYPGIIGYVYPTNEESYFLTSGYNGKLYTINCLDGYFYGSVPEEEV